MQPTVDPKPGDARELSNADTGISRDAGSDAGDEQRPRRDFSSLDHVLELVMLAPPLTCEDAVTLFEVIRPYAPAPLVRDVMCTPAEIIVRLYDGHLQIYERRLRAK